MDSLYKIIGIALITCIATLIVKPVRPDFAVFISIVGGIIILFMLAGYLTDIFDVGYSVLSIGDIFIRVFVFIIIYNTVKHLNVTNEKNLLIKFNN